MPEETKVNDQGQTPTIPEITPERGAELTRMQNTAALIDQAVMDSAEIHKALGRIEGVDFLRRVGDVFIAQTFIDVRNNKKYKGLPYKDEQGNLRHVEDFEEFCRAFFGKSYTRCYELAKNLHLLGSDLYEAAEAIGFRSRDYAALKALPAAEQEVVKQALASESREQVLDILQDMAARHVAEKAAAAKEREELTADLEARDQVLKDKSAKVDKLSEQLEKLKRLPPNKQEALRLEQEAAAADRISTSAVSAVAGLNEFLGVLAEVKAAEDVSMHTQEHADWTARWVCQMLNYAIERHGIEVDFEDIVMPAWQRDLAKAGLKGDPAEEARQSWRDGLRKDEESQA